MPKTLGARALVVGLTVAAVSCQGETGVLIAVSGPSAATLEFEVGVKKGELFELDKDASGRRADVAGRNLNTHPYELMLEEPSDSGDPLQIRVLVLGITKEGGQEKIASVGLTDPPQRFIRGEVLRRTVRLQAVGDALRVTSRDSCHVVRRGDDRLVWAADNNHDCDPIAADAQPPDCNDADPSIYPGLAERCDEKDNNCDDKLAPTTGPCYGRQVEEGPCRLGVRPCEGLGGAERGDCVAGDEAAPEAFCQAYSGCAHLADPLPCIADHARRKSLVCSWQMKANLCGGAYVQLEPPQGADSCRWRVFADGGFSVNMGKPGEAVHESSSCKPVVRLSPPVGGATKGQVKLEFIANGQTAWLVVLAVEGLSDNSCAENPLSCEEGG